ncbi:MAG TPA: hypothetical protein VGK73_13625 [Polyangiaceae bacterium]
MRWAFAGVLRGFSSFVEGARLSWTIAGLRRLALASSLVTLVFIGTVLLLLEGFERGRLVALANVAKPWSTALTIASAFVLLFAFPVLGPLSSAIQGVAAARTRAAFDGGLLPGLGVKAWFGAVVGELAQLHRRWVTLSLGTLRAVLPISLLVPADMTRLRALLSLLVSLALFALHALFRRLEGTVPVPELLRRWPELVGFVLGSWGLTLFGLGPWFVVLDVVSAEVFRVRLRAPGASVDVKSLGEQPSETRVRAPHAAGQGRIPEDIAARVHRRYERAEPHLTWNAEPPKNVRYEYLPLRADPRPGEYQIGALLPTNEDDTLNLSEPIRFWVVVSDRAPDDGRYRRFMDDRFAGPLEA